MTNEMKSKDQIILKFDRGELSDWIKKRLEGSDKYFSVLHGRDSDLSQFMIRAYKRIGDEEFRKRFMEIVYRLIEEIREWDISIINDRNLYIYELLSLCLGLNDFGRPLLLFMLAESGKFKGIKAYDTELHMALLSTMAVHDLSGYYRFWWKQMDDDSNPNYTNAAFYALLSNHYAIEIIFEKMDIFIQRFMGKKQLKRAIRSLCSKFGIDSVVVQFKKLGNKLNRHQKQAVRDTFKMVGYSDLEIWPKSKRVFKTPFKFVNSKPLNFSLLGRADVT